MEITNLSTKQSLKKMLIEQAILLEDIIADEISEEQEYRLTKLETNLPWKVEAWISVLKKDGLLDFQKEKLKEKVEMIKEIINSIDDQKQRRLEYLHSIMAEIGIEKLCGTDHYIKRDISYRSVIDMSKVEGEFLRYNLPELSSSEFEILINSLDGNPEVRKKLMENVKTTCGVKDLPEGHQALTKELTPIVRFYRLSAKKSA